MKRFWFSLMLLRHLPLTLSRSFPKIGLFQFLRKASSFFALPNRELISLRGFATAALLQGLMTNDVRLIEPKNSLMYSLFLNVKGRVVSDALIYHGNHQDQEEPHFVHISEEPSLRVLVNLNANEVEQSTGDVLFVGKDPRAVPGWCLRMLCHSATASETCASSEAMYRRTRYCLGLPEGADEFKSGEGLPLEANADLCHGVSFSKGCYVGQELTARSRFVGVIRRRVAPILFESAASSKSVPLNSPIFRISKGSSKIVGNRPVGWVRGQEDPSLFLTPIRRYGLALLRLAECAAAITSGDKLVADISGTAQVSEAAQVDAAMTCFVQTFAPHFNEPQYRLVPSSAICYLVKH
ncbi:hypothetical protein TcWFU_008203 [Taenia crassiceps]|uniref:Uncharacterized protein n=1 Tax=Taenia crassiceps TaxID=6207 RepID=A0ABR4Q1R6_9CEST